MSHILAIDQGTTSTRSIVFDGSLAPIAAHQQEFPQHFPQSGWVEHDPEDLWATTLATMQGAIARAGLTPADISAIGITNQRETTLVWDKSGRPIYNAIVWQDRRTAQFCADLREAGHEAAISAKTGLILDPYFSATKLAWILDHVDGARAKAEAGELFFGTVDCYLVWRLTEGRVHATDATNAARTMLFNIHDNDWDADLCALLNVPMQMLPQVLDCADDFGETTVFGPAIAIRGVAGDQQAATIGQACFKPGMIKSTYGTGCFALMNTGDQAVTSSNRMLTTIAYRLDGKVTYALEGSIFIAGAVVQWLRDGLGIIKEAKETQPLAERADEGQSLYMVPAFTGLGAPWWDPDARGAIYGLTRNSGPAEFARAALESVGFQTSDLIAAILRDVPQTEEMVLRVDGGMAASDWTMQFLSDITGRPVDRPKVTETTALGVAWLAGMKVGLYPDQEGFAASWDLDRTFTPSMAEDLRKKRLAGWRDAVERTLTR